MVETASIGLCDDGGGLGGGIGDDDGTDNAVGDDEQERKVTRTGAAGGSGATRNADVLATRLPFTRRVFWTTIGS